MGVVLNTNIRACQPPTPQQRIAGGISSIYRYFGPLPCDIFFHVSTTILQSRGGRV